MSRPVIVISEAQMKRIDRWFYILLALALLGMLLIAMPALAKEQRSSATTHQFQRAQPCPSTGRPSGACPGYVKDHVVPLCKGGADRPGNLQWQSVAEGKAKDRWECK